MTKLFAAGGFFASDSVRPAVISWTIPMMKNSRSFRPTDPLSVEVYHANSKLMYSYTGDGSLADTSIVTMSEATIPSILTLERIS